MVMSLAPSAFVFAIACQTPSADKAAPAPAAIGPILEREGYPWYDAKTGKLLPVLSWPDYDTGWLKTIGEWISRPFEILREWFRYLNFWRLPFNLAGVGDLIAIGLVMLVLTALMVGLLELLRRYRPVSADLRAAAGPIAPGSAQRIDGMPAGVGMDVSNPWAEAVRRRKLGDFAGAVVYLFAHQLLTLDRLNKIRLTPGKTGRQLVRSVREKPWRDPVEPTLRLFEAVYYGHQEITADAFEGVWSLAELFERRASGEVVA